jgi:hypothetical protein
MRANDHLISPGRPNSYPRSTLNHDLAATRRAKTDVRLIFE